MNDETIDNLLIELSCLEAALDNAMFIDEEKALKKKILEINNKLKGNKSWIK
jgi:hypothetical protein|tara:strand:+ start:646 stop:801 length:156 start_codon:yes stop_codon:yes gene_type:complete